MTEESMIYSADKYSIVQEKFLETLEDDIFPKRKVALWQVVTVEANHFDLIRDLNDSKQDLFGWSLLQGKLYFASSPAAHL